MTAESSNDSLNEPRANDPAVAIEDGLPESTLHAISTRFRGYLPIVVDIETATPNDLGTAP